MPIADILSGVDRLCYRCCCYAYLHSQCVNFACFIFYSLCVVVGNMFTPPVSVAYVRQDKQKYLETFLAKM